MGVSRSEEAACGYGARDRLVTRSDLDGLVYAVLPKQLGLVEDSVFVHPKDVQDGQVEIVIAVGKSIQNRTSGADISALMYSYSGGHSNARTRQVAHDDVDRVVDEFVGHLNATKLATI